jgi:hypothetical protein
MGLRGTRLVRLLVAAAAVALLCFRAAVDLFAEMDTIPKGTRARSSQPNVEQSVATRVGK